MSGKVEHRLGVDVGSTTAKFVLLDSKNKVVYSRYMRHNADITGTLKKMLLEAFTQLGNVRISGAVTGSAGMGVSERLGIPFVQEVVAAAETVSVLYPDVRTLIDVGGEDSKMIFFDDKMRPDMRMNGSCAGGTGAFIDQMAALLDVPIGGLEHMARESKRVHTIASRCGVFAKTDVQNLLSREVSKEDIAISIFHAVAQQTLSALSRGHDIVPKIMFCGGPFTFLPTLKKVYLEQMGLDESSVVDSDHPELIPAMGTALTNDVKRYRTDINGMLALLEEKKNETIALTPRLQPLFSDAEKYEEWESRRMVPVGKTADLSALSGRKCFVGIDSGSTTTKIVVIDEEGNIAYQFYENNRGDPIGAVIKGLEKLRRMAEEKGVELEITGSAVTGYGEDLIKSAFSVDIGMVETMAHFRAAKAFLPEVSFILDIGGQDMKAIYIRDGLINNIEINEACSSGCGSFLETFANTLNFSVQDFSKRAVVSRAPADLGTRCTVFMNSKVKQSLREGASVEDISSGLAYSVIRNCLYKVLKIKDISVLGDHIVVQGGTFRNPAVHRALEKELGRKVICSDIPELMGAYGAALTALDTYGEGGMEASTFISMSELQSAREYEKLEIRCAGCTNHCQVTRLTFNRTGQIFYTGNKCERIFTNRGRKIEPGFNMAEYKINLLFNRPAEPEGEPLYTIGIPRGLNMYEDYPFWSTLLVKSGMKVVLSPESSEEVSSFGVKTVMSDNICFPAKVVNGHVLKLIHMGVDRIFYPIVGFEKPGHEDALNTFNCPVVTGYPDVIRSAVSPEEKYGVPLDTPSISFRDEKLLKKACWNYLKTLGVPRKRFNTAFEAAMKEQHEYKARVRRKAAEVVERAEKENRIVIFILGRPYHVDPLVNHKIPELISQLGADVITEDSIPLDHRETLADVHVLTQWEYPNRIFSAAKWAIKKRNVEVVELTSFGCGPDAVVTDEVREILHSGGKNQTLVKIDEVSSPGSIKLRLRSMMESIEKRGIGKRFTKRERKTTRPFVDSDRKKKILVPYFSRFYSPLIASAFRAMGYDMEVLPEPDRESVDMGLKYTNNDICYPATIVIGDILKAMKSGKYDLDNIAVGISQTGGQCRASSYISLLKKGLTAAGYEDIPVVSVSFSDRELNYQPGFEIKWKKLLKVGIYGLLYADAIMQMYHAIAVREKKKGEAKRLMEYYLNAIASDVEKGKTSTMQAWLKKAVQDFNSVEVYDREYPTVGMVGEIYIKYNNFGHMYISDWLIDNGIEVVVPPILDFFSQWYVNVRTDVASNYQKKDLKWAATYPAEWIANTHIKRFERVRKKFRYYRPYHDVGSLSRKAEKIIHPIIQFGEGWLIPAEVSAFVEEGINNVLVVQPFGCIANHIIGKGIEKKLKDLYPDLNILNLDLDSGTSEVNVYNRLNFLAKAARDDFLRRHPGATLPEPRA